MIWALLDSPRLRPEARQAIESPLNEVFASVVNAWEMAVKVSLRKLRLPPRLDTWLAVELQGVPLQTLPVLLSHAMAVEHLPFHHRDPFDRLLIAQATVENLTIVTGDPKFEAYSVPLLRT